jgi:hypothetical protein
MPTIRNPIQGHFAANKVNPTSNRVVKLSDTHRAFSTSLQVQPIRISRNYGTRLSTVSFSDTFLGPDLQRGWICFLVARNFLGNRK